MTEMAMPKLIIGGRCDEAEVWWQRVGGDGGEWSGTIAATNHALCAKVLNRKTKGSNLIETLLSM
jgi:hypothetical protein